jgi:hypothetical protein
MLNRLLSPNFVLTRLASTIGYFLSTSIRKLEGGVRHRDICDCPDRTENPRCKRDESPCKMTTNVMFE